MLTQGDMTQGMHPGSGNGMTPGLSHGVTHWLNAARFAAYAGMHTLANEYLNKASLIASINDCRDGAREIGRLVDELRVRRTVAA